MFWRIPTLRVLSLGLAVLSGSIFIVGCSGPTGDGKKTAVAAEADAKPNSKTTLPSAKEQTKPDAPAKPKEVTPPPAPQTEEKVAPKDPLDTEAPTPKLEDDEKNVFEEQSRLKKPFRVSVPIDEIPRDTVWLNTSGPLRKQDFKGKFVLLDFWTYCCINCMHILPELKKLEKAYPNNLVVIGVHSAKFDGERNTKNIEEAILRYEIEHPVVNDADHKIWNSLGVNSWPTVMMLDPEGNAVWGRSGEFKFDEVDQIIKGALPYYRENKLLDEKPLRFDLLAHRQAPTPLRFPGKVLGDEKSDRLFIADSNHNRVVVTKLDGTLITTIGSGAIGFKNGDFATATFNHPQGMALLGEILYVADTENHMLRKVDLAKKIVSTVSGTGEQGNGWPGIEAARKSDKVPDRWVGSPKKTELNSPWDLWIHGKDLYIAMAGPHQIWKMPLDESEIGPFAGNGREDIVDGPHIPKIPYEQGYSSFAQPSGLSSDGKLLFVADSEGSSIRAVPFDSKQEVKTVVGTAHLPGGRLFHFGDKDGKAETALLQHALGVTYYGGKIFTADTYNNKIKIVDATTGETKTLAGTGKPGASDSEPSFDEPAGINYVAGKLYVADTNNHLIRVVDPQTGKTTTLEIKGLTPPAATATLVSQATPAKKPNFDKANKVKLDPVSLKPTAGSINLKVSLKVPTGWKINPEAPMSYYVDAAGEQGAVDREKLGKRSLKKPVAEFDVPVAVTGNGADTVTVSLNYYYCEDRPEGVCKFGAVVFTVPVKVAADAKENSASLVYEIQE